LLGVIGRPLGEGEVEGRDHAGLVRGEGFATSWDAVVSDTWFQESSRAAIWTPGRQCQQDFGSEARQVEKGLFKPGCFDRRADPLFTRPIEEEALMGRLTSWRAEKTAALAGVQAERVEVGEELGRQLEALGYRE